MTTEGETANKEVKAEETHINIKVKAHVLSLSHPYTNALIKGEHRTATKSSSK